ncbi:hypothetical protein BC332_33341 [Capsicum chinense]|nr:hypothetical protein BC332_33341 [Capsicum chinense]
MIRGHCGRGNLRKGLVVFDEMEKSGCLRNVVTYNTIIETFNWRNGPHEKPMLCNACGLRWRTRQTLDGCVPKHANGEIQSSQLPSEMKPARDDQKLEVGVEVSGQHGSSACLEEEMNNISAIGSAGSASDNCIQMEETNEIGVFGRDKMGDHNMRLHEMRKEIDALKGSMEGVASSVSKMGDIVDTKVTNANDRDQAIDCYNDNGSWAITEWTL